MGDSHKMNLWKHICIFIFMCLISSNCFAIWVPKYVVVKDSTSLFFVDGLHDKKIISFSVLHKGDTIFGYRFIKNKPASIAVLKVGDEWIHLKPEGYSKEQLADVHFEDIIKIGIDNPGDSPYFDDGYVIPYESSFFSWLPQASKNYAVYILILFLLILFFEFKEKASESMKYVNTFLLICMSICILSYTNTFPAGFESERYWFTNEVGLTRHILYNGLIALVPLISMFLYGSHMKRICSDSYMKIAFYFGAVVTLAILPVYFITLIFTDIPSRYTNQFIIYSQAIHALLVVIIIAVKNKANIESSLLYIIMYPFTFAAVNQLFAEYIVQEIFGFFSAPALGEFMSLRNGIW